MIFSFEVLIPWPLRYLNSRAASPTTYKTGFAGALRGGRGQGVGEDQPGNKPSILVIFCFLVLIQWPLKNKPRYHRVQHGKELKSISDFELP